MGVLTLSSISILLRRLRVVRRLTLHLLLLGGFLGGFLFVGLLAIILLPSNPEHLGPTDRACTLSVSCYRPRLAFATASVNSWITSLNIPTRRLLRVVLNSYRNRILVANLCSYSSRHCLVTSYCRTDVQQHSLGHASPP